MENFYNELFNKYLTFFIFTVTGFAELIAIIIIKMITAKKIKSWNETTGIVTEVVAGRGSKGGTVYYPVFEFKTYINETIKKKSKMGSGPGFYSTGSEVAIFYKPDDPNRFIIKGDKRFNLMFIIIGLIGGLFFIIGTAGIIWLANQHNLFG